MEAALHNTPPKPFYKKWSFLKWVLIIVLLGTGILYLLYHWNYSEGERVGKIIKLSHKGNVINTWEGQLDQGTMPLDENGMAAKIWNFSLPANSDQVRVDIDKAVTRDKKVKVHYYQRKFHFFWRGDTDYFLDKVEIIE